MNEGATITKEDLVDVPISFDSAILSLLSTQLYTSQLAAYREFIQNEKDAGAKNITFNLDVRANKTRRIVLRGDGHGIENVEDYSRVANAHKAYVPGMVGEKGIGRISYLTLADVVEVHSACEKGTTVPEAVRRGTSLNEREKKLKFVFSKDNLNLSINKVDLPFDHGTELVIEDPMVDPPPSNFVEELGKLVAPLLRADEPNRLNLVVNGKAVQPPAIPKDAIRIEETTKYGKITGYFEPSFEEVSKPLILYNKGFMVKTMHNPQFITPRGEIWTDWLKLTPGRDDLQLSKENLVFNNHLYAFLKRYSRKKMGLPEKMKRAGFEVAKVMEPILNDLGFTGPNNYLDDLRQDSAITEATPPDKPEATQSGIPPEEEITRTDERTGGSKKERELVAKPHSRIFLEGDERRSKRKGTGVTLHFDPTAELGYYDRPNGDIYINNSLFESMLSKRGGREMLLMVAGMEITVAIYREEPATLVKALSLLVASVTLK